MKRSLIHQFAEVPQDGGKRISYAYDRTQNLNIMEGSQMPAVYSASLDTETFTKAQVDANEHDPEFRFDVLQLLDTDLNTRAAVDQTSSDQNQ